MDSTVSKADQEAYEREQARNRKSCYKCGRPFYGELPHIGCEDWGTEPFNAQNYTQRKGV